MGLLDALQYSPSQSGGLLELLQKIGIAPGGMDGLPSDRAQYGQPQQQPMAYANNQPSPLDTAQWPAGPQGAPSEAMARMPEPSPPVVAQQPQPSPQATQGPPELGFFDRLNRGLQSVGNGGSVIGAFTGNQTDPASILQRQTAQTQNVTAQALRAKGVDEQTIAGAIASPELFKALIAQKFPADPKDKYSVQTTGVDAFGKETKRVFNSADGTFKDAAPSADAATPEFDNSLKGEDYLKQFPPEVQSQVRDYIAGKTMPTGNPRRDNVIKRVASKYGEDIGTPADDTTFGARRQMRTQLSSSAPSSLGGQINIGNTAAGHLADLTEQAIKLDNSDGFGIPMLAHTINSVRGMSSTDQAAKMEALKGAAQHYGQEITKFYAGSPGGVAERDRFIESVGSAKSPKELAAILATEGELMRSRLDALGGQIKGVLGEEGLRQYPVLRPDGHAALVKVEENVSRLRGAGAAQKPASQAAPDRSAVESEMRRRGLIK